MGCCQGKQVIITPLEKSQLLSSLSLRENLLILAEELFQEFESLSRSKLSCPRSLPEINQILRHTISLILKKFEEKTSKYNNESNEKLISIYKFYLLSKCKSAEGPLRNKNDIQSFEHLTYLKHELFELYDQGKLSSQELLEMFQKFSKGTFLLRGLNEIHELINLSQEERKSRMKLQEENDRNQLARDNEELAKASQKIVIPLIELENVYSNMNNLQSLDASFEYKSDLKCEDLEADSRSFTVNAFKMYANFK